jgi:4-hydroxybenzoate polyprenyltransferase
MKLLKRLFQFYVNASLHVAIAVVCLVAITSLEFGLDLLKEFYLFVFFGTITAYNFVKYAEVAGLHHRSLTDSLKTIQIFSFICFAALLYFAVQQRFYVLVVTFGFGVLTLLYAVPFLKYKNLRNFPGLKLFIVAIVWAGITVIVPVLASEEVINTSAILTFTQRVCMVIVLTIPFEIRDLPYDIVALRTLPQLFGVLKTKWLGTILVMLIFSIEAIKGNSTQVYWLSLLLFGGMLLMGIWFSREKQSKYYASFWVESFPIWWLGILLLIRHFLP